jgi:CheY-like chemotaxis protein
MSIKQKILVVDDLSIMQITIKRALESIGYDEVETCGNGKEALDKLNKQSFYLVISDINMPIMNGLELLQKVRSNERLQYMPFILISGDANRESVLAAVTAGVSEFITKPFTPATLKQKVALALQAKSPKIPVPETEVTLLKPATLNEASTPQTISSKNETILVVDDIPDNIDLIVNLLRNEYRIKAATSGRKALSMIQSKTPPDLILLDIMMPDMDGYEVCEKIKSDPSLADIPIIFLSAKGEVADITKGFSLGAVDYVTKPIEPEILKARIKTHLALRKAHLNLKVQVDTLLENARLREDVQRITQHDLKNPLGAISCQIDMLIDDPQYDAAQKEQFHTIKDSTNQGLAMVANSLDLFKMETGSYKLKPVPVNIHHVIEGVVEDLHDLAIANLNKVKVKVFTKYNFIFGEEMLCYSIISNLLRNAIEASPTSSAITIAIENKDKDIALRFYNEGVVPEAIRGNLFDKYVTAGKDKGTGLGTYSAKMATLTLRGNIIFETTNEKSTIFTVTLPQPPE